MLISFRRVGVPALLAGVAASCITFPTGRTVALDPLLLEDRGEVVFGQYLIPVTERVTDFRVRSGPFRPDEVWGAGAVAERVACGGDEASHPLTRDRNVELSVELRIGRRSGGSRVSLESRGHTLRDGEHDEVVRCALKQPFVEELLTAIAGPADGLPAFTPR